MNTHEKAIPIILILNLHLNFELARFNCIKDFAWNFSLEIKSWRKAFISKCIDDKNPVIIEK